MMDKQVVSKKRVADYGEVFTGKREVNAMLDMVKQETERIESRFLVPACGKGNFLTEILERKLYVVETRYRKSQLEYERNAVLSISSIYGIDILEDNVVECRKRLFELFDQKYSSIFKNRAKKDCRNAMQFILKKNIIWGDALTLKTVSDNPQPIVFSEWSPVKGSFFKRRDFAFHELFPKKEKRQLSFFSKPDQLFYSDLGNEVFLPSPVKDYPLTYFMRIDNVQ
jgi:hypothetical protein